MGRNTLGYSDVFSVWIWLGILEYSNSIQGLNIVRQNLVEIFPPRRYMPVWNLFRNNVWMSDLRLSRNRNWNPIWRPSQPICTNVGLLYFNVGDWMVCFDWFLFNSSYLPWMATGWLYCNHTQICICCPVALWAYRKTYDDLKKMIKYKTRIWSACNLSLPIPLLLLQCILTEQWDDW